MARGNLSHPDPYDPYYLEVFRTRVRVNAETGCWDWVGSKRPDGYGQMNVVGYPTLAHRWSYDYFRGTTDSKLHTDHLCRNRGCVNPYHLERVPTQVNWIRGESPLANYARATSCVNGHPFTSENTRVSYSRARGYRRSCRTCDRRISKNSADRKRAVRVASGETIRPVRKSSIPRSEAEAVGKRLAAFRASVGLSQSDLSSRFGVCKSSIGNYESGKNPIPDELSEWLLSEFGWDVRVGDTVRPDYFVAFHMAGYPYGPAGRWGKAHECVVDKSGTIRPICGVEIPITATFSETNFSTGFCLNCRKVGRK